MRVRVVQRANTVQMKRRLTVVRQRTEMRVWLHLPSMGILARAHVVSLVKAMKRLLRIHVVADVKKLMFAETIAVIPRKPV